MYIITKKNSPKIVRLSQFHRLMACVYTFYNDFIKSDYVSSNSKEIIPEHLNLNTKIYELTKKIIGK